MHLNCSLIVLIFTISNNSIHGLFLNPFKALTSAVEKVDAGINAIGQGIWDTVEPAVKTIRQVDEHVFGSVNQGIFEAEKGVIKGLNEVVGTPVNMEDVHFYLLTPQNMEEAKKIDASKPSDVADTKGYIFFIVHGFLSSRNASWVPKLTKALLWRYPDSNVVQVDWSKPAGGLYPFAVFNAESVGGIISGLLLELVNKYGVQIENLVLMGHSIGGHTVGFAAKKFTMMSGKKLPLLISFDPAGPLFCLRPENRRLNKHDATVVKVIHSDGGKMGFLEPCGTIDYFPNGGSGQPGCAKIEDAEVSSIINPFVCDHFRAYDYFIEAVNRMGSFDARRCPSFTDFRFTHNCEDVESKLGAMYEVHNGSFFLQTKAASPFSMPLKPLEEN